jgi:hypothetical protein
MDHVSSLRGDALLRVRHHIVRVPLGRVLGCGRQIMKAFTYSSVAVDYFQVIRSHLLRARFMCGRLYLCNIF